LGDSTVANIDDYNAILEDLSGYEESKDEEIDAGSNMEAAPSNFKIHVPQEIVQFVIAAGLFQKVTNSSIIKSNDNDNHLYRLQASVAFCQMRFPRNLLISAPLPAILPIPTRSAWKRSALHSNEHSHAWVT
jgi:hypothetical protein